MIHSSVSFRKGVGTTNQYCKQESINFNAIAGIKCEWFGNVHKFSCRFMLKFHGSIDDSFTNAKAFKETKNLDNPFRNCKQFYLYLYFVKLAFFFNHLYVPFLPLRKLFPQFDLQPFLVDDVPGMKRIHQRSVKTQRFPMRHTSPTKVTNHQQTEPWLPTLTQTLHGTGIFSYKTG